VFHFECDLMKRRHGEIDKAWKIFWKAIKDVDVVLEVLDPRAPNMYRNRSVEQRLRELNKRIILVINKADLVPKEVNDAWKEHLSKEFPTVFVSTRMRQGTRILRKTILRVAPKIPVIVGLMGYPNVGKSSIINVLRGKHGAGTSPMPGFTRHMQLFNVTPKIKMMDTPGIFPPLGDDCELTIKGALRAEKLINPLSAALCLLEYVKSLDAEKVKEVYGIDRDGVEFFEELARKRGRLLKGGVLDVDEAARIFIREWQIGKLVVWELPNKRGIIKKIREVKETSKHTLLE